MPLSIKHFLKGLGIQNENDRTKTATYEVSDSASADTNTVLQSKQTDNRTLDLPDTSGELVEKDYTQTLTNKTIGDTNTIYAQTDAFSIQDATDQTKELQFDNSLATTGTKTTLATNQTTNKTLILPDANDTLVGKNTTDTLQNKSMDFTAATGNNTISMDAVDALYDNSTSGLTATEVQSAIDEVEGRLDTVEAEKLRGPQIHADNILIKTDGVDTNESQVTGISVDDSNNVTGINDLTIDGNLTVNGDSTIINTTVLDVEDINITINKNGTDVTAEGAGLTVERTGTNGSLVYEDALASKFKVGAEGAEVEIADVSTAQAITNKDLADSSNNIDTASADSLTRATGNQQVVTIPDTATPDNIVLEAHPQVLTNKDYDGGTASSTSRMTAPQETLANLLALPRKAGTVVYANDTLKLYFDNGVTLIEATGALGIPIVGSVIPYLGTTAPTGYVLGSGKTIGSATSGATERANADTFDLYNLLWNSQDNTLLPIQDSSGSPTTRGASALDDFNADKRLPVPDLRDRVFVGKGDMGGVAANRITPAGAGIDTTILGASGGTETHILTEAQMPTHTHIQNSHFHVQGYGFQGGVGVVTRYGTTDTGTFSNRIDNDNGGAPIGATNENTGANTSTITATNQTTGGSQPHQNTQPSYVINKLIKL